MFLIVLFASTGITLAQITGLPIPSLGINTKIVISVYSNIKNTVIMVRKINKTQDKYKTWRIQKAIFRYTHKRWYT